MANQFGFEGDKSFPELAEALRAQTEPIIKIWTERVRGAIPSVKSLSDTQLRDNLPKILGAMADALAVANGTRSKLVRESPEQGQARFHQNYDVHALMHEDRLLRQIIIEQTESELGRRMSQEEQLALDMCVDLMLQQSVAAFVDEQNAKIRASAESELKYLSFLSHDLTNNLGGVTLFLESLRQRLTAFPEFAQDVTTLNQTLASIVKTIDGMDRLLQTERVRKAGVVPKLSAVNLLQLISNINQQTTHQAELKGLQLSVDVPKDAVLQSDGELITLVLQNLIGNAVKFSAKGVIRIAANLGTNSRWFVTVADEGPGISKQQLDRIFEAFARGDSHGQTGVGLGLAIASEAAKLLGAELTVESTVGAGSKFSLALPPNIPAK